MTTRFSYLTKHANLRVNQRTKLTWIEVVSILDRHLYVDSGTKPGLSRHHLVFYSAADDRCFVAIQDTIRGRVHTVLPLEYQKNLAWAISDKISAKAKLLYERDVKALEHEAALAAQRIACESAEQARLKQAELDANKRFSVTAMYFDSTGKKKFREFMKIPSAPYGHEIANLLHDVSFPDQVQTCFEKLEINPGQVSTLLIRLRKKDVPVAIELQPSAYCFYC